MTRREEQEAESGRRSERSERPVAIVTGSSRGIGRAIAVALGSAGFGVVVNYRGNEQAAMESAEAVFNAGGEAVAVKADIGVGADRQGLVDAALEAFGDIDLLVNNAGMAPKVRADLLEMDEGSYDGVLATNLKGPVFLTQLVARHMAGRGMFQDPGDDGDEGDGDGVMSPRAIVNIGSISAYAASVNRGEYCIAKAGLSMMTQLFAVRLAEVGVNVYEIRPGIIATDMTAGVEEKYDKLILEDERGISPIRRWGRPEDVAQAVLAIAEGRMPFSTGQVIDVDGGFHIHRL